MCRIRAHWVRGTRMTTKERIRTRRDFSKSSPPCSRRRNVEPIRVGELVAMEIGRPIEFNKVMHIEVDVNSPCGLFPSSLVMGRFEGTARRVEDRAGNEQDFQNGSHPEPRRCD